MKTIDLLNSYLADLTVVERNIHILHWNVNGKSFKSVHEYLENIYKDIYNKIDEIAEMIRIHGEIPDANLSDNVEKSIIEEIESKNKFNHIEAIGLAKQDIEKLMDKLNELFEASESDKLYDVNDSIGSYIADFGKFKYFLENDYIVIKMKDYQFRISGEFLKVTYSKYESIKLVPTKLQFSKVIF